MKPLQTTINRRRADSNRWFSRQYVEHVSNPHVHSADEAGTPETPGEQGERR
jgi:hypothetical protein